MKPSTLFTASAALMIVVALTAACDLVFNGNEGGLTGVIGASIVAILLTVIGWLARHFENE